MKQAFLDVARFHAMTGVINSLTPVVPQAKEAEVAMLDRLANELEFAETHLSGAGTTVAGKRVRLMASELKEVIDAILKGDLHEYADGLADLCYVVIGSAVECGIPLDKIWEEVQRANMMKGGECMLCGGSGKDPKMSYNSCFGCSGSGRIVTKDAGGKVMKPEGFRPPDHTATLGPNTKR